jgi:cell wall-associated NlpC family hydrolase
MKTVPIRVLILAMAGWLPAMAVLPTPARPAAKAPSKAARTASRARFARAAKVKPPSPLALLPQMPSYLLPPPPEPYRAPGQCEQCANRLLMTAYSLIGTRYRYGGSSPTQGFDCSGFTRYVYQTNFPLTLPPSAPAQFNVGIKLGKEELQPGDLVFFRHRYRGWHVGMYVGDGSFIHAPNHRLKVMVTPLDSPYFRTTYVGARRIPLAEQASAGN